MKAILPILALLAPTAYALPEFDTSIVGPCRDAVQFQIAAANQYACPSGVVLGDVTDVDGNRYTVDFKQPACGISGEAEITFGRHEQTDVKDRTLIPRCELLRTRVTDSGRD